MAQESLAHMKKKESTAKWFIFMLIPVLNLYWTWKAAEIISGHEKIVEEKYEKVNHMDKKEPTGKWFFIFLIPIILGVTAGIAGSGLFLSEKLIEAALVLGIFSVIAFAVGIYLLYKMAISVSGHETSYPEEYETVNHMDKKESTAKWFIFGLVPILNIYFGWKMSETISGHETVYN